MCFFCKQKKEDVNHVFSCNLVAKLFSLIRDTLEEHDFILSTKNFLLYTISLIREQIRKSNVDNNINYIFKYAYKKQIEKLI
jgi:hypothetical protein